MRNVCCKCPHYYEQHGYECDDVDWGCTAFGREFENCPSFDDGEGNADFEEWGCNEKQNRIDYTLNKLKRKSRALGKICEEKEQRFYKKIYSVLPKEEKGYKAYKDGKFQGFLTHDYRPNMKGGHTHNHIYNKCHKHIFRSKQARKNVDRKDKPEFVRIMYMNLELGNYSFDKLLHTIFHHNKKNNH